MAASYSGNAWTELDAVCKALPYGTAVDLKQIIITLNTECGTHMARSGKKQDLVDRLRSQFSSWKSTNSVARWRTAKAIIDAVKLPVASFMPVIMPMSSLPPPPHGGSSRYASASKPGQINPAHVPLPPSRSTSIPGAPYSTTFSAGFRFKQSPFFTIDQPVSAVLECPESYSATDRRECTLKFHLTDDQIAKLGVPGSGYQLRLFCTSSKFYSAGTGGNADCPIEFPQTCEIYVNDVQLKALLKGIKKRPGTAPPPELTVTGPMNSVRIIYINGGQGQLEFKKYYLVVQLVKAHTVSALVDQLVQTRFIAGAEIRRRMVESMPEDDDIVAGSLKMSLKCPLSFMRIRTPCRSIKCTHSQCFDANSWYAVMQQTTTWLCPVCENVLDWRELIIDGYFAEILKTTPDSVDDVLVESDGEWRTADNKFSSAKVAAGAICPAEYNYVDSDSDDDY
ncbi:PINIT domain-containing protein [Mycena alexandri]|uniref:PINIT domain-containing protein n=1 Tax=Mycena alexandri TaxID=1745969 RepID=A0AAD6S6V5_9AGAR|nr:PINIT domain-containing protein [Mycena alexandri]